MKKVLVLHKKEGETPLNTLLRFKKKNPQYHAVSMTYAGRLDPMASGVLLILAGDKIKDKEKYLAMDKEYDFSILFGFATDTHDILGKILPNTIKKDMHNPLAQEIVMALEKNIPLLKGKIQQLYPLYSSKTVNGMPLFMYARSGKTVKVPSRDVVIKKLVFKKIRKIHAKSLFLQIEKRIRRVAGDFRQKEIIALWKKSLLTSKKTRSFLIAECMVRCSSGTYVRQIAHTLGVRIGIPALAFSIRRTRLGRYRAS